MQSISTFLQPGGYLAVGDYVTSPNLTCFLIMQEDGNLVLYKGSGPNDKGAPIWASNTDIGTGDYFSQMQTDGNFCIYKGKLLSKGDCIWASGTYGIKDPTFLMVQDDFKIVVYRGTDPNNNKGFVWQPKTVPLNERELRDIANKYAPILRFHPDENYLPCSVEWFLQQSTLCGIDGTRIPSPTVNQLPTAGTKEDGKYWLEMKDSVKSGDLSSAKVYVNVQWKQGQFYTDFEYWFFSGYNGPGTLHASFLGQSKTVSTAPVGEHWADWEMVMVRVDNATLKPLGVYLSQHGEGEFITDLSRFQRQSDQFIVYSSLNGHANYPSTGENPTNDGGIEGFSWHLNNYTADNGQTFNSKDKIEVVAADYLKLVKPQWLSFPYRWGKGTQTNVSDVVKKLLGGFTDLPVFNEIVDKMADQIKTRKLDDTNGPYGPQTQSYWTSSQIPSVTFEHGYTGINTTSQPAVLFVNGVWHCYYRDIGRSNIMHAISMDGYKWEPKGQIDNQTTSEGPFASYFNNQINLFYRDGSGNRIYITPSTDGYKFNGAGQVDRTQIDGTPNVAVLNDIQCLVGVDAGKNGIMAAVRKQSTPGQWEYIYTNHSTQRNTPISIVAFKGLFHIYYRDGGRKTNSPEPNDGILHATSSDGINWSGAKPIGYKTSSSPCAVVANGKIILFFRDPDKELLVLPNHDGMMTVYSNDGENFKDYAYTGLNINSQPNATVVSDRRITVLAKDAGGNDIMWLNRYNWN